MKKLTIIALLILCVTFALGSAQTALAASGEELPVPSDPIPTPSQTDENLNYRESFSFSFKYRYESNTSDSEPLPLLPPDYKCPARRAHGNCMHDKAPCKYDSRMQSKMNAYTPTPTIFPSKPIYGELTV